MARNYKLTESQQKEILEKAKGGISFSQLSKEYGVSRPTIKQICNKKGVYSKYKEPEHLKNARIKWQKTKFNSKSGNNILSSLLNRLFSSDENAIN